MQFQADAAEIILNLCCIARLWQMIGEDDEMERVMARALDTAQGNAEHLADVADSWACFGEYRKAIELARAALQLQADQGHALFVLGTSLLEIGELDEGISALYESAMAQPEQVETHLRLGVALIQVGRPDVALRAFDFAMMVDPDRANDAHVRVWRALALAGEGCNEEAFECVKGMEAQTAGDADLGVLLATLYGVALRRPDLAIPLLTQALDDEPEHSIASVGLVTSLDACGRREEAEEALELLREFDAVSAARVDHALALRDRKRCYGVEKGSAAH
ncbi:MAG: tetratricopeptide repeat protein [Bacillota bacterium]